MIYMIFNSKQGHDAFTMEDGGVFLWKEQNAFQVLKYVCIRCGSSYEGRRDAAKKLLHITQKVPILVSERERTLLFPTKRIKDPDCIWINYATVVYTSRFQTGTRIVFRNGKSIVTMCDIRGVDREMKLCEQLFALLAITSWNKV